MDVRTFITNFEMPKRGEFKPLPSVIKEGREENVYFYTEHSNTRYIIEEPSSEFFKTMHIDELTALLPKFGKFEIEYFFESRFLNALLVTHDMTEIFNTTVLCADSYWSCKFDKEDVKEIFLKRCFTVTKEEENTIYLKLTGKYAVL